MKKFTLIELLVVIAIIGILASILLPSLSKARFKAEQAVCLSNQNQIAKGAFAFSNDQNGNLPSLRKGSTASNVKSAWKSQLSTYLMDQYYAPSDKELTKGVFRCPTSLRTISDSYNPLIRQAGGIAYNGYGLRNLYKSGLGGSTGPDNMVKIEMVLSPSQTYLTTDSTDNPSIAGDLLYVEIPSTNKMRSPTRHSNGGVMSFVDGHGAFMKYAVMEAGRDGDRDFYLRRDKNKAWGSD